MNTIELREVEGLKKELRELETEEQSIRYRLAEIAGRKKVVMEDLKRKTDPDYEKDMLSKVYEQRHLESMEKKKKKRN
jgi:hypothetical protein